MGIASLSGTGASFSANMGYASLDLSYFFGNENLRFFHNIDRGLFHVIMVQWRHKGIYVPVVAESLSRRHGETGEWGIYQDMHPRSNMTWIELCLECSKTGICHAKCEA